MKKSKTGKIDISALNVPPEKHEYDTAKYFAKRGLDIKFITPHYLKGFHNPDFEMGGRIWETKSPIGKSKRTYEDNFRKAIKQSENIIFDLRRLNKSSEKTCLEVLTKHLTAPTVKRLLVIKGDGRLLTLKGKFDKI